MCVCVLGREFFFSTVDNLILPVVRIISFKWSIWNSVGNKQMTTYFIDSTKWKMKEKRIHCVFYLCVVSNFEKFVERRKKCGKKLAKMRNRNAREKRRQIHCAHFPTIEIINALLTSYVGRWMHESTCSSCQILTLPFPLSEQSLISLERRVISGGKSSLSASFNSSSFLLRRHYKCHNLCA